MTVRELIEALLEIKNKDADVLVDIICDDESLITYGEDMDLVDESENGPVTLMMKSVVNRY